MIDLKKYTEANRLAWNEAMPRHQKANQRKWDDSFSIPGYIAFKGAELEILRSIGVSGKNIAHPCCNKRIKRKRSIGLCGNCQTLSWALSIMACKLFTLASTRQTYQPFIEEIRMPISRYH